MWHSKFVIDAMVMLSWLGLAGWTASSPSEQRSGGRCSPSMKCLGPVTVGPFARETQETRAAMRELLWTAWVEKKCACIVGTGISLEGEERVFRHSVDRDEKGTWHIRLETRQAGSTDGGSELNVLSAYTVQRIHIRNSGLLDIDPIAADAEVSSSDYHLLLTARGGVQVEM